MPKKISKPPPSAAWKAIYYLEREEVKQAMRLLALSEGHNSIGVIVRRATQQYLDSLPKQQKPTGTSH